MAALIGVAGAERADELVEQAALPVLTRPWEALVSAHDVRAGVALGFAGERGGIFTDRATGAGATSIALTWKASEARDGAPTYQIFDNGRKVATTRGTSVTLSGLTASSQHRFTVEAVGLYGDRSGASTALPITTTGPGGPVVYQAEDPANTINGTASIAACEPCSGGAKVGNLGGTSSFTFTTIHVPVAGDYLVTMACVDGSASRQAFLTVDGTTSIGVNFQGSNDDDWNHPQEQKIMVHLDAGTNTINVGHPTWYVSDIDAFTI